MESTPTTEAAIHLLGALKSKLMELLDQVSEAIKIIKTKELEVLEIIKSSLGE